MVRFKAISIKVLLTIHLLMCCMIAFAQNNNLDKALKDLYIESWSTKDFDDSQKEKLISLITESNYNSLSDSAKYIYHLWSSDYYYENKDTEKEKKHVEEAVKLCESSIGILNSEYLFLLCKQGFFIEGYNIDKAISIYQKGIIIGQTMIENPQTDIKSFEAYTILYGNILTSLAELYDKKGWTTRVEELYERAFRLHTYYNEKSDSFTYGPLNMLSNYYERKNEINKSIDLLEWEISDIKDSGYYGSSAYVSALYHLGSAYSKGNQDGKALDTYRIAVKLALDSLAGEDETLFYLYRNYCVKLAELNQIKELDEILPIVHGYYSKTDSINTYTNILFLITDRLCNNRDYREANKYCDSLLQYPSYHTGYEEVIYSKKALTSYMCEKPDTALLWQKKAMIYCLDHNGENSIIYTNYLADLAFLYKQNSMNKEAINEYLNLIKILENNNRDTITFYDNKINDICELYDANNNPELKYKFLMDRKQISYDKYGETPFYAKICNMLSVIEMNAGKLEEAKKNNQIAENLNLKFEGKKSINYAIALHNKGRILMFEKKYKQALKPLTESKQIQVEVNGSVFEATESLIKEIEKKLE